MRYLLMSKASDTAPDEKLFAEMGKFIEELTAAGVLLATGGLEAGGVRVTSHGDEITVIDGPFTEAKELVAGFWLWQVKSLDEAIEWARRCPSPMGDDVDAEIEVRQVFETADFPPDVLPEESAAREDAMREELQRRARSG
jgi:hypothetical protein